METTGTDRNILVFLLGKCYRLKIDEFGELFTHGSNFDNTEISGNTEFCKDFISRMWLTYGKEFLQLKRSALATDCGWGCAMTTGQMLLAQGLMLYFLGRAWVWPGVLYVDNSDSESWTAHTGEIVAHILRKAVGEARDSELQGVTVHVAQDCPVYSSDVIDRQCSFLDSGKANTKAVFILVPVRLSGERTNMDYLKYSSISYYFAGFQDDSLIYVHLHYCQLFVDVSIKDFRLESFHCPFPRKIRNIPLFTFVKGHSRDGDFRQLKNYSFSLRSACIFRQKYASKAYCTKHSILIT
uniref:Cysteine protease n=1 Tax=Strigops habroptila TaxID=2489341 RepID=A0A672V300_STRHB